MFVENPNDTQLDLFSSPEQVMNSRQLKKYQDEKSWFNMYYKYVLQEVDETIFKPLYSENMGKPNSPVNVLVCMQQIKEGQGWSDRQLEEAVLFNLAVRKALGLVNIDDSSPVMSTFYDFRAKVNLYNLEHGRHLMAEAFHNLSSKHLKLLELSGTAVRMDSKLLDSNIADLSRYEIVWRTLDKTYKRGELFALKAKYRKRLEAMLEVDAQKTKYESNSAELSRKLQQLGQLVYDILVSLKIQDGLLHRVFHEQFEVSKGKVSTKSSSEITATSVQNPEDTDATFRKKNDQKVSGISVNVTETVPEGDKPSIILDAQVENASTADNFYTKDAVATAEYVTGNRVEYFYSDGAYASREFREFAQNHGIVTYFTGLQGKVPRYSLELIGEQLFVTNNQTGEVLTAEEIKAGRWRIRLTDENGKHKYVYFSQEDLDNSLRRQMQIQIPKDEFKKRNNVEAAMFQLSYHTRDNQTRYRGLASHRLMVYNRCAWMNFVRIAKYLAA